MTDGIDHDDTLSTTGVSAPRRRITTERRERPFRIGIALCVVGLLVLLVGTAMAYGVQTTQILGAVDRAEIPNEMTFDADDDSYAIVLLRELPGFESIDRLVAITTCTVTLADGTNVELSGARQSRSLETDLGRSIGRFDAQTGPTTVACSFGDSLPRTSYFVAVAPEHSALHIISYVLSGIGLAAIAAGIVSVIVGVRGRMVVTDA